MDDRRRSESSDDQVLVFGDENTQPDDSHQTFVGSPPAAKETDEAKTQIVAHPPNEARQDVPVLSIDIGDDSSEMEITSDRFVIGRSADCDVVIVDQLVSRHHAVIKHRPDGWHLEDRQSGNGTFLNNKRIRQTQLVHEDVIRIGEAQITFRHPQSAIPTGERTTMYSASDDTAMLPAQPQEAARRKYLLIGSAGLAALVVVLGVIKILTKQPPPPDGPTPEELAAIEQQERVNEAQAIFVKLKALVRETKWVEALDRLNQVEKLLTDLEEIPDGLSMLPEYKATVHREAIAQKAMLQALALGQKGKYAEAIAELRKISEKSEQFEEAMNQRRQLEQHLRSVKLENAHKAMDQKKWLDALAMLEKLLIEDPENQEVAELKRKAEEMLHSPSKYSQKGVQNKNKKMAKLHRSKSGPLLRRASLSAYRNGELDRALSQANSSGVSSKGTRELRELMALYARGKTLSGNPGQAPQAKNLLVQSLRLDKKLGGGKGKILADIKTRLGKVCYIIGADAQARKKYPIAFQNFLEALRYRPDLTQAQERLRDLQREAQNKFEEAYVIKSYNPDKAISLCKTVLRMVKKEIAVHRKCQNLLNSLQNLSESTPENQ